MDERTMLELAAKAGGIKALRDPNGVLRDCIGMDPLQCIFSAPLWNSLTDSGDCFGLAVKLDFNIYINGPGKKSEAPYHTEAYGYCKSNGLLYKSYEPHGDNAEAATRLAITRLAAEIGATL